MGFTFSNFVYTVEETNSPTFSTIEDSIQQFLLRKGNASEILNIMSARNKKDKKETFRILFDDVKFKHLPYEAQRSLATRYPRIKYSFSWICEFGTLNDLLAVQNNIMSTKVSGSYEEYVANFMKIARNPSVNETLILNLCKSFWFENEYIGFLSAVPEEKLNLKLLLLIFQDTIDSQEDVRKYLLNKIRVFIEVDETIPKGLPNEWVLKIADLT